MAAIKSFNKSTDFNAIRASINSALLAVEKEFGIKLGVGNLRYTENSFKTELAAVIISTTTADPYLANVSPKYINAISKYTNTKKKLLTRIKDGNRTYVVVGVSGRSVLVKLEGNPEGGMYKFGPNTKLNDEVFGFHTPL